MNVAEDFPRPTRLDRVVITDPKNPFYSQVGILVHMPNDIQRQLRALVVPDSNTRAEVAVDQLQIVHERYAPELNLKPRKEAIAELPEVVVVAASALVLASAPTSRVEAAPLRSAPVEGAYTPGKRGKPRTTLVVTQEVGDAALVKYNAGEGGMVAIAQAMNVNPAELSAYFKRAGIILKKGRKTA